MVTSPPATPRRTVALAVGAALLLQAAVLLAFPSLRWRPLQPVALLWLVALALAFPRDRVALGVLAVGTIARGATWSPRVVQHFTKAFTDLDAGRGILDADVRYGDAWPTLIGVLDRALGDGIDAVHTAQALVSGLLPPLVVDAVRRLGGGHVAAVGAGLVAAVSPFAVALAPTETRFVLAATLEVALLVGALRGDTRGDLLAATSVGLLAFTRSELVLVALVGLVLLAARRRLVALGAGALLVAARGVELVAYLRGGGDTQGLHAGLDLPGWWTWVGAGSRVLALDPTITPTAVGGLLLLGAATALQAPPARWPLAFLAVHLATTVQQPFPSDLLRFQLPADAWVSVLAGLGLGVLAERSRAAAGVAALAVLASLPFARPFDPPFVWQAEHTRLRAVLPRLPEQALVRYAPDLDLQGGRDAWLDAWSVADWRALDGPEQPGEFRWVGAADRKPGAAPVPWERLEPVDVVTTPARWGGLLPGAGDEDVRIGLYRVTASAR